MSAAPAVQPTETRSRLRVLGTEIGWFGLLGLVSFGVNVGLTWALHEKLRWSEEASFATSLVVVFILNFLSCRFLVFDARGLGWRGQMLRFGVASMVARGWEFLLFVLLQHSVWRLPIQWAVATVLVVSFVAKFFFYRRWVFGHSSDETKTLDEP
ncbi:MAG: GtrA family protein [Thermoanaerobaculia bacterium]|nr:GtrA family protein [Thermoanaerobaculia bacterium]